MDVPHSVLHRMFGGPREAPRPSAVVHDRNAKEVVRLARQILKLSEVELPFESILWKGEQTTAQRDRGGGGRATADVARNEGDTDKTIVVSGSDREVARRLQPRHVSRLQSPVILEADLAMSLASSETPRTRLWPLRSGSRRRITRLKRGSGGQDRKTVLTPRPLVTGFQA
jgi:hypothetical protein